MFFHRHFEVKEWKQFWVLNWLASVDIVFHFDVAKESEHVWHVTL